MPAHDAALRRRGVRRGEERGLWLYVPAELLDRAGFKPDEPVPYYRTWAAPRGRVVVQLYRER